MAYLEGEIINLCQNREPSMAIAYFVGAHHNHMSKLICLRQTLIFYNFTNEALGRWCPLVVDL